MPYVKEFSFTPFDERRDNLLANIETVNGFIRTNRTRLAGMQRDLEVSNTEAEWWSNLHQRLSEELPYEPAEPRRRRLNHIYDTMTHYSETAARAQRQIPQYEESIMAREAELAQRRMQLDALPAGPQTVRLNVDEIKAQIVNKHVRSVKIFERNENHHSIRVVFEGVMMRPSHNRYWWINKGNNDFRIKLPPILCDIWVENCNVTLKPIRGQVDLFPRGFSGGPQVHPHITSYAGNACWGDYGGPITEALHEQNIPVVIDLVCMFLQQANAEDPAGSYWVRWLDRRIGPTIGYNDAYAYSSSDRLYYFYQVNQHGDVVTIPHDKEEWPLVTTTTAQNGLRVTTYGVPDEAEPEQSHVIEEIANSPEPYDGEPPYEEEHHDEEEEEAF